MRHLYALLTVDVSIDVCASRLRCIGLVAMLLWSLTLSSSAMEDEHYDVLSSPVRMVVMTQPMEPVCKASRWGVISRFKERVQGLYDTHKTAITCLGLMLVGAYSGKFIYEDSVARTTYTPDKPIWEVRRGMSHYGWCREAKLYVHQDERNLTGLACMMYMNNGFASYLQGHATTWHAGPFDEALGSVGHDSLYGFAVMSETGDVTSVGVSRRPLYCPEEERCRKVLLTRGGIPRVMRPTSLEVTMFHQAGRIKSFGTSRQLQQTGDALQMFESSLMSDRNVTVGLEQAYESFYREECPDIGALSQYLGERYVGVLMGGNDVVVGLWYIRARGGVVIRHASAEYVAGGLDKKEGCDLLSNETLVNGSDVQMMLSHGGMMELVVGHRLLGLLDRTVTLEVTRSPTLRQTVTSRMSMSLSRFGTRSLALNGTATDAPTVSVSRSESITTTNDQGEVGSYAYCCEICAKQYIGKSVALPTTPSCNYRKQWCGCTYGGTPSYFNVNFDLSYKNKCGGAASRGFCV